MKIFVDGTDCYRRGYFGWQDQDTALIGLKMGYKNSADDLVNIALNEGKKANVRVLDTYIFPIVFMYRHSIEASLKSIYVRFYGQLPNGSHDLVVLWDNLNTNILSELEKEGSHPVNDKEKSSIRRMLNEFNVMKDGNADVFRYLMDKKCELYFTESKFIDYDNLKEAMHYIYDLLDSIYSTTDHYLSS